jgi:hypothetical protein
MRREIETKPTGAGLSPEVSVPGWGVDADAERRPGVPAEFKPPRPSGSPPYNSPPKQATAPKPLVGPLRTLTAVYSTAAPVRGVSGWLRKRAYRQPDYHARRWLMLMAADRIDALEHGHSRRYAAVTATAALLGVGFLLLQAKRSA